MAVRSGDDMKDISAATCSSPPSDLIARSTSSFYRWRARLFFNRRPTHPNPRDPVARETAKTNLPRADLRVRCPRCNSLAVNAHHVRAAGWAGFMIPNVQAAALMLSMRIQSTSHSTRSFGPRRLDEYRRHAYGRWTLSPSRLHLVQGHVNPSIPRRYIYREDFLLFFPYSFLYPVSVVWPASLN
jgi:hypothetical protein